MRKWWVAILAYLILLAAISLMHVDRNPTGFLTLPDSELLPIRAAVLYNGATGDAGWQDRYSRLSQPLVLNFEVDPIDTSKPFSLDGYDILYPDVGLITAQNASNTRTQIEDFVENGGAIFLDNAFHSFFENEFIGADSFAKLDTYPAELGFPDNGSDLNAITEIILDFSALYPEFYNFSVLAEQDYGWMATAGQATVLVSYGKYALYTMNNYGDGTVFFTNPLLPNSFSINGFMFEQRDQQEPFSCTTTTANQLIENAFIEYIMKQQWGFSIARVFGNYGTPMAAWSLHYEEITGIANDSARIFGEIAMGMRQPPSYTIIRNSYWWYLRAESVSVLINQSNAGYEFEMDVYENAYSSGTHVLSGSEWLSLGWIENTGSYFIDYPEYDMRMYPFVADFDGDGDMDILLGGADGYFYLCSGEGYDGRLRVSEKQMLCDMYGTPLSVVSYSAPVMADLTGDGIADIISGAGDGNIYIFEGVGGFEFKPKRLLIQTQLTGQSLPDVADVNGDGLLDIVIGSNEGKLLIYYAYPAHPGAEDVVYAEQDISSSAAELGLWLSPRVVLNNEGAPFIAVGTFDGYIARILQSGGTFRHDGFFETEELNYKGNSNLKFGNNAVPFFADINGDGTPDLIVGNLEYGLAYPIDSELFPYREELASQIKWMQENDFYASAHFFTSEFSSKEREDYEIAAHKEALEGYGMSFVQSGTNQHTWQTSTLAQTQSFTALWEAGFLWNSAFRTAGSSAQPHISADNTLSLPFFLIADGERTILLQNCSNLLYRSELADISARYGMPIVIYYHCDFAYETDELTRADVQAVADFQERHGYNFAGEHQMMKAIAAAHYGSVSVRLERGKIIIDAKAADTEAKAALLYDEAYAEATGAKITFSQRYSGLPMRVSRDFYQSTPVWRYENDSIYFATDGRTVIEQGREHGGHISSVNVPARFRQNPDYANSMDITFQDGGMMELRVFGEAETLGEGWTTTKQGEETIFTKFAPPETLTIVIRN